MFPTWPASRKRLAFPLISLTLPFSLNLTRSRSLSDSHLAPLASLGDAPDSVRILRELPI